MRCNHGILQNQVTVMISTCFLAKLGVTIIIKRRALTINLETRANVLFKNATFF